jgi:hypothetical protein
VYTRIDGARHWLEGTLAHLRTDVSAARKEVSDLLRQLTLGSLFLAIAGVLGLLGTIAVVVGAILLLGDQWLPRDLFWVAALLVVVITGPLAYVLSRRGNAMIAEALADPVPETIESLTH